MNFRVFFLYVSFQMFSRRDNLTNKSCKSYYFYIDHLNNNKIYKIDLFSFITQYDLPKTYLHEN